MRTSISIGTSAAAAAVFTHGMVDSAMHFDSPLPASTYEGFFRQILLATEQLWSYAQGWPPMSHIRDFGHIYASTIQLVCPLIGFALFRVMSGHKVGIGFWKPLAIALLLTIPPGFSDLVSSYATPWAEAVRTILIILLMAWSVGAIRISKPHTWTAESLATVGIS